jgi:hypothetical protein
VWFGIAKQLKFRCGSMCWHTWAAPGWPCAESTGP